MLLIITAKPLQEMHKDKLSPWNCTPPAHWIPCLINRELSASEETISENVRIEFRSLFSIDVLPDVTVYSRIFYWSISELHLFFQGVQQCFWEQNIEPLHQKFRSLSKLLNADWQSALINVFFFNSWGYLTQLSVVYRYSFFTIVI